MIRIELPWPSPALNPNGKRRLRTYMAAKKSYRDLCYWIAREAVGRRKPASNEALAVTITFSPPDRRRRDRDNMIASFKHGQDAVAMALGVDDRIFEPTYRVGNAVSAGRVTFECGAEP